MANIANLSVQLTVNSSKFTKKMNAARKPVSEFSKTIRNVSSKMTMLTGAFASFAAASGLTAIVSRFKEFVKESYREIDVLAKTADKLGLTTQALGAFRFAANKAGLESSTMDMALQRMTRRLSEAAYGMGEAQGALKELGLDAKAMAGSGLEEQLYIVADALADVKNPADRVRLAFKLFDSEGVAMVNMLDQGAAGLKAARKEFEALGSAVDRLDAAKIEAANDAMTAMGESLKGISQDVAVETAPYVKVVADQFTWLSSSIAKSDMAAKVFATDLKALPSALGASVIFAPLAAPASAFVQYLERTSKATEDAAESITKAAEARRQANADNVAASAAMDAQQKLIKEGAKVYEETRKPMENYQAELDRINNLHKQGAIDAETHARAIEKAKDEYESAAKSSYKYGSRAKAVYEETRTPLERYMLDMQELNELLNAGAINQDMYNRAAANARDEYRDASGLTKMIEDRQNALEKTQKDISDRAARVFDETRTPLEEYESELDNLNDLFSKGAINQDTYNRAIAKMRDELYDGNKPIEERIDKLKEVDRLEGKFSSDKFGGSGKSAVRGIGVRSNFAPIAGGGMPVPLRGGAMMPLEKSPTLDTTNEILRRIEAALQQPRLARAG